MFGYDIFLSEHPEFQEFRRRRNEARAAAFYAAAQPLRGLIGSAASVTRQGFAGFARWRRERAAVNELSALSDRVLADIGLQRRDIRSVARSVAAGGNLRRTAAELSPAETAPRSIVRPTPQPQLPRLTAIQGGRTRAPKPLPVPQPVAGGERQVAVGCG